MKKIDRMAFWGLEEGLKRTLEWYLQTVEEKR
jgi:hypothetical protein